MDTNKVVIGLLLAAGLVLGSSAVPAGAQSSASSQVGLTRTGTGSFNLDVTGADLRTVLRAISERLKQPVSILQDLSGPKIRVGEVKEGGATLKQGGTFVLTTRETPGSG